ncbi:MAG: Six-hairpin glycosidase-like protein, partial [Oleiagrimonas sp.]|nr:Six-hairpin glycosidase-like protein [Oleiagrimonas sp.]
NLQCFSVTAVGPHGLESLHSPETCVGPVRAIGGAWPRGWTAKRSGVFLAWLDYVNDHGPINTGITAAVRRMRVTCGRDAVQVRPIVMPQSDGRQDSTRVRFDVRAGQHCTFALAPGFNMSDLAHFVHFTGGQGGATGPLNAALIGNLHIAPLAAKGQSR